MNFKNLVAKNQLQNYKHMNKNITNIILLILVLIAFSSCKEKPDPPEAEQHIVINFDFKNNGEEQHFDTMMYINEAGNHYMVNEIQLFISDVILHNSNGSDFMIDNWKEIHYVDSDIQETHKWEVFDNIPAGDYDNISFTFGIIEEKNHSFMFPNPPERDMFWPEILGGGYHYMKLNGKWLDDNQQISPFDFHIGTGQIYYSYPDSITAFVDNSFEVILPNSSFHLGENSTKNITFTMNVEKWFESPHTYDHNIWKGYIMQNQEAMTIACENGHDVFSVEF